MNKGVKKETAVFNWFKFWFEYKTALLIVTQYAGKHAPNEPLLNVNFTHLLRTKTAFCECAKRNTQPAKRNRQKLLQITTLEP